MIHPPTAHCDIVADLAAARDAVADALYAGQRYAGFEDGDRAAFVDACERARALLAAAEAMVPGLALTEQEIRKGRRAVA